MDVPALMPIVADAILTQCSQYDQAITVRRHYDRTT